jgi:transposase
MRFYSRQHQYYCGVDLHARSLYLCILDQGGEVRLHRRVRATPEAFLTAVAAYRDDLVVAVECMFTWYWLADLCRAEGIAFVLGHALYMKAIHGGKAKNDRIDAKKIAVLLRGGMLPEAALPLPPDWADAAPNAPDEFAEVVSLAESSVQRIRELTASLATRSREGQEPALHDQESVRTLERKLAVLEALLERFRSVDARPGGSPSLTADLDVAREVCEVVEGLVEGRGWGV